MVLFVSFRHLALLWRQFVTINNPALFCANLWDWACLDGCFGNTRISPMDIDGIVERHGKFLFIETKAPGVLIPAGQLILLEQLAQKEDFTVLIVYGCPGNPTEIWYWDGKQPILVKSATIEDLRNIVKQWFQTVDTTRKST